MREGSRPGARRQAQAKGRAGAGRDARTPGSGGPAGGRGPAGSRSATAPRPGAGYRPGAAGAPDAAKVTRLIEPVLHAMDVDLETVKIASAGRRRVLRVVVDADGGLSLDEIAEVSREISAKLDAKDAMGDAPYTLEVSSPGIDRPLTEPRHWRRAAGRLVVVQGEPSGQASYEARVIEADQDQVTLEVAGERRTVSYSDLGPGRVQVEFGHLPDVGDVDDVADPQDLGHHEGSWDGTDEEGPDGH